MLRSSELASISEQHTNKSSALSFQDVLFHYSPFLRILVAAHRGIFTASFARHFVQLATKLGSSLGRPVPTMCPRSVRADGCIFRSDFSTHFLEKGKTS